MPTDAGTDLAKFAAAQGGELIKQADTKATATFYVLGISTAALMARLTALKSAGTMDLAMWFGLLGIATVLILAALKMIISVLYPRLSKGSPNGMIYFRDILTQSPDTYAHRVTSASPEEAMRQYTQQAYALARVADKKFQALRHALALTGLAIIWTVGVLLFT